MRTYCAACGKPLPRTNFEPYPGGTSTAVGPAFYVGQSADIRWNRNSRETADILRRLAWISVATAALFVVAVLEWQTWHRPVSTSGREMVAVAAQSGSHEQSQPSPPSVRTSAPPASARPITAPITTTQPAIQPSLSVLAQTPSSSPARKLESAPNDSAEQLAVDDDSAKVKLLRAAMNRGDADAPVGLANLYLEGKEVSHSCDEALSLLESAAAKPNARARNRLAAMYEIGTCVQRDRVQAYRWLSSALAADRNNAWAQENREQTWREMTSDERAMAEAYR